ncbi:GDP-L-fucose synthase [bioreactor metagenome]|uniref:GDP-L-fucose synthase n=1 Tax=bioreactor metagenome TaxID=1076179 RepID=A0A645I9D5_9ZZZZ
MDDLADACVFLLERHSDPQPVNIGWGEDIALSDLAEMVRRIVGYRGKIDWDTSRPDGTPRKLLDVSRLKSLGWFPSISLEKGIEQTYRWYCEHREHILDGDRK